MKKLLILLFSVVSLLSCDDDSKEQPEIKNDADISISSEVLTFLNDGNPMTTINSVTITSSGDWRMIGDKTWCVPSVTSGKSGEQVVFDVERNEQTEPRSATFTFICGNKSAKLLVRQSQENYFAFEQTEFDVSPSGERMPVRFEANTELTYKIADESAGWITQDMNGKTRNVEKEYLYFVAAANDTYKARSGAILFKDDETGLEQVITVNQPQNDAVIPEATLYNAEVTGGELVINVRANVPYEVVVPEKTRWITHTSVTPSIEPDNGLVAVREVLQVEKAALTRAAKVYLRSLDGRISIEIVVKQIQSEKVYADFPDENFRKWLINQGYAVLESGDKCELTEDGMTEMAFDCTNQNIVSFEGIEAFANLESLDCSGNNMTVLDVSRNTSLETVICIESGTSGTLNHVILGNAPCKSLTFPVFSIPAFGDIIVSGKYLESLNVSATIIKSLDVSECPSLVSLNCTNNSGLLSQVYLKTGQEIPDLKKDAGTAIVYK